MDQIRKVFEYLTGPEHVAEFQKLCGIQVLSPKDKGCDAPCANGPAQSQNGEAGKIVKNGEIYLSEGQRDKPYKNGLSHRQNTTTNGLVNGQKTVNHEDIIHNNGDISESKEVPKKNGMNKNGYSKLIPNGYANHAKKPHVFKRTKILERTNNVDFKIQNKFFYLLFCFGASLGNEIFYIIFYPFCLWNFDGFVTRKMCIVWQCLMYLGQVSKDIVQWPRPASPPVVRLEERYQLEFGMPSTHAMVGTIVPFGLLYISHGRYEFPFAVGLLIATLWSVLVMLSRLYLGMHTGLDLIAGWLSIVILMPPFLPYLNTLDDLQMTHHWAPLVTLLGPLLLCHCYPTLEHWSTTRGDTALILSVSSGISVGNWLLYQRGWMQHNLELSAPIPVDWPSVSWLVYSCVRLVIGVVLLSVIRTVIKPIALRIICFIWGIDILDIKHQRALGLEVPHKFMTYFSVAVCATYTLPVLFSYMGIIREGYFLEL